MKAATVDRPGPGYSQCPLARNRVRERSQRPPSTSANAAQPTSASASAVRNGVPAPPIRSHRSSQPRPQIATNPSVNRRPLPESRPDPPPWSADSLLFPSPVPAGDAARFQSTRIAASTRADRRVEASQSRLAGRPRTAPGRADPPRWTLRGRAASQYPPAQPGAES